MNSKNNFLSALVASIILVSPTLVFAKATGLQVAIVKDSLASQNILSGDFEKSIKRLTHKKRSSSAYEKNMGLCVAYLKSNNSEQSESSCTTAIESLSSINTKNSRALYLKAIAYSNRGVARYLNDDLTGAIDDLTIAKSIDENSITKGNLRFIEQAYAVKSKT